MNEIVVLIDSGMTGAEVARRLGLSRERVRQVYKKVTGRPLPRVSTKAERSMDWLRARVVVTPSGCWEWSGGRNPVSGYGQTPENVAAHRVAWEIANGPIPDGQWVLHKCDNRPCCNPDHLMLGTQADNIADMKAKGRARPGYRRTPMAAVVPPTACAPGGAP